MTDEGKCAGPDELSTLMDLLSHDMLNKNQATLSYLELIHSRPGDEERTKEFAERAASQVRASSMLLDGIKRFVASTREKSMPTGAVDLLGTLESVSEDVSDMFTYKRIKVDTSWVPPGASVRGSQCVHDLFMNLIVNLVQLDTHDELRVEVGARQEDRGGAPFWVVEVTAPTAAFPAGADHSIFSNGKAVDVSKMTRVSGAVFAGSIARALGGGLESKALDPERNQGCVFEVSLEEGGRA